MIHDNSLSISPQLHSQSPLARAGGSRPPDIAQLLRCSTAAARACLSRDQALRWQVLPLALSHDCTGEPILSVLTSAERESEVYQMLRFVFTGALQIERAAPELDLTKAIRHAYDGDASTIQQAVRLAADGDVSDGAVSRLVQAVLVRAQILGASDIHVVPISQGLSSAELARAGFTVLYRVHGSLRSEDEMDLSGDLGWAFIRRLKVLANLDLTINHQPQEGACVVQDEQGAVRFRLSIIPTVNGPKVALRLLEVEQGGVNGGGSREFSSLGLAGEQERTLKAALGIGGGVILCVGPTGSGKSTLLHSVLRYLHRPELHLVAIEDPVERFVPGVSQCEINEHRGVTYNSLLRAMLRQDPDVVMLGEIRDSETAELALAAGLSGHLILSTLHAGSCIECFSRLSQLGVSAELATLAVRLIVAQRLLPLNCPACAVSHPASPLLANYLRIEAGVSLYSGTGCSQCDHTGRRGRIGVFELLLCTENVKRAARQFATTHDVGCFREALHEEQYEPYSWRVREALVEGKTSPRAALEALGLNPEIFGY